MHARHVSLFFLHLPCLVVLVTRLGLQGSASYEMKCSTNDYLQFVL